jgi:hypothetical protein
MKLFLLEEHSVEGVKDGQWLNLRWQLWKQIRARQSQQSSYSPCKRVELVQIIGYIEVWVLDARNEKSCMRQIDSGIFSHNESFKRSVRSLFCCILGERFCHI